MNVETEPKGQFIDRKFCEKIEQKDLFAMMGKIMRLIAF